MLKIRALNRESSSDEEVPVIRREAQEEIALEFYNKALRLQSSNEFSEAEEILLNLINENIPQLENHGGLPSSMSTLKYSCYCNLGNIYIKKDDPESALDCYLNVTYYGHGEVRFNRLFQASELDDTDVTAFSKGLDCSESHWPCLDQLISLVGSGLHQRIGFEKADLQRQSRNASVLSKI